MIEPCASLARRTQRRYSKERGVGRIANPSDGRTTQREGSKVMATVDHNLSIYQELADLHDRRKLPQLRDRFLVLAADTAQRGGLTQEAERLRLVLLQLNPHHLLKSFATFEEALRSPDVQSYLTDLRQSYPPDAAEHLLDSVRAEANAAAPVADELPATLAATNPAGPGATAKVNEPLKVYRLQNEPKQPAPAAP